MPLDPYLGDNALISSAWLDPQKTNVEFEKATGRERRRWLELRHNQVLNVLPVVCWGNLLYILRTIMRVAHLLEVRLFFM